MEDRLDEKDIAFKPRKCKGKNGKKKYWPDSSANNIIYYPDPNVKEIVHMGSCCGMREDITDITMAMETIAVVLN